MPELPEVEVISRCLSARVVGREVVSVTVNRRDLRVNIPDHLEYSVTGTSISDVYRVAKYLVMKLSSGNALVFHFGMSGRIIHEHTYSPQKHDHVVLGLRDGHVLVFNDPRRFGLVTVVDDCGYRDMFARVGPDPFSDDFNVNQILRFHGKAPIKTVLLNGVCVSGIGNIYASEILFRASILPSRKTGTLSREECKKIVDATRDTLQLAIENGGSTIRDYRNPEGITGNFPEHFKVYNRAGKSCCCGYTIQTVKQGGRSTFFCPQCQK